MQPDADQHVCRDIVFADLPL